MSRVMAKSPDLLLLRSDHGDAEIEVVKVEGNNPWNAIIGRVVFVIRALQYTIVKPTGKS
jgi:hypothetical protein